MSHPDLVTVCRVLGDHVDGHASSVGLGGRPERYTVIPSAAAPRLLVPRGDRRVATSAVRHTIVATSRQSRLRQQALVTMFAIGVGRRSLGDLIFRDTVTVDAAAPLSAHLAAKLGTDVRVSMRFGPSRANRKPVLQLVDASGACVAFVKVGVNELTRGLVRREAEVLRTLESIDLDPVRLPRVMYAGPWHDDAELLVVEALPVWRPATAGAHEVAAARTAAMRAVAATGPAAGFGTYLDDLDRRIDELGDNRHAATLRATVRTARDAGRPLAIGAWHGDWNGGNMAVRDAQVLVWDWERYATGVPVGFDALHYEFGLVASARGRSAPAAAADVRDRSASLLAAFDVAAGDAGTVWALYATEIATRFLADRQDLTTSKLGQVADWIDEALTGLAGR